MDTSLPVERVIRVPGMLVPWRGYLKHLRSDNEPESISYKLKAWAEEHNIKQAFIQPGKLAQNAFVERFNRTFRGCFCC